jgi:hypothetical protein
MFEFFNMLNPFSQDVDRATKDMKQHLCHECGCETPFPRQWFKVSPDKKECYSMWICDDCFTKLHDKY